MPEKAEGPNGGAGRMTETQEIPPLIVARDALTFTAGGRSTTFKLEALHEAGGDAVVGFLLWGILLKLHDLELDFRRAIDAGEERAQHALGLAEDPTALFGTVKTALEKMGIEIPIPGDGVKPGGEENAT